MKRTSRAHLLSGQAFCQSRTVGAATAAAAADAAAAAAAATEGVPI